MAAVRDLYEILGIARGCVTTEIKAAYRKLARTLHPDVNADPADQERFKEITGAYEILSDPTKRQRYDEFGAAGPQGAPFGDIQDIFDMFFGGGFGGRTRGPRSRGPSGGGPPDPRPSHVPRVGLRRRAAAGDRASRGVRPLRWERSAAGHVAGHVPNVRWRRRGPGRPPQHLRHGHDRDALCRLRRDRRGDPGPLRGVRRRRSRSDDRHGDVRHARGSTGGDGPPGRRRGQRRRRRVVPRAI